jgi:Uma2 family endonuclease
MVSPGPVDYIEQAMAQADVIPIYAFARHFPVRFRPASRLSDDELFELCARNGDLHIERTSEGEVIVMSPTGGDSGRRNFLLIVHLGAWAAQDGTGVGFDSSTGFLLPNGAERAPDASWLRRERWDALTPEQRRKFVPLCPDFVVELRSPSDDLTELQAKMDEYIACGVRLGWLLDVESKRAWVYRPGRPVELVEGAQRLTADPELPGLVLDLSVLQ